MSISSLELKKLTAKFDSKLKEIISEDLPILKKIKKHVIESGGKRIRPLTHYFLSQMLGYNGSAWVDIGSIAELIHGASLLHDDVVDGAELRRGVPTVGKLYGNKQAILAGDYLLACGIDHLNRFKNPELMSAFTSVIRDLSVGELIQMEWEKSPKITRKIYEKVIYGKTASLFGAAALTAGILAETSGRQKEILKEFGINMGMLFQMKDDYIDYFEKKDKSGKIPLKDFQNGLYTYPVILLLEKIPKKEQNVVHELISKKEKKAEDDKRILNLMNEHRIENESLESMKGTAVKLVNFLRSFPESKIRELMITRIEELVE